MKQIYFIDTEVSEADKKAYDFGSVNENDEKLHTGSAHEFHAFIEGAQYICGHNIINHDSQYIEVPENAKLIDTLYLSPLMFPNKPYHIENNLRAFASKVLIHFLGVNWIGRPGLEKYECSVKNLQNEFTQRVPDFDDINTDFLSMTLETLVRYLGAQALT